MKGKEKEERHGIFFRTLKNIYTCNRISRANDEEENSIKVLEKILCTAEERPKSKLKSFIKYQNILLQRVEVEALDVAW